METDNAIVHSDTGTSNDPCATPPGAAGEVGVDHAGDGDRPGSGAAAAPAGVNHPRYASVRRADQGEPFASYDIVDNLVGAERVLAYAVRYRPAQEIVIALNESWKAALAEVLDHC